MPLNALRYTVNVVEFVPSLAVTEHVPGPAGVAVGAGVGVGPLGGADVGDGVAGPNP